MNSETEVIKKICLIGAGEVGKTSLIKRFILDIFDDKYLRTLGTKVSKKDIVIKDIDRGDGIRLTMLIWDIMGQATFRTLLQDSYFFGASGALAVCDCTRIETLEALMEWVNSFQKVVGKRPVVLLANKCDLRDDNGSIEGALKEAASKYNTTFLYTSARTGEHVEDAFYQIGRLIV